MSPKENLDAIKERISLAAKSVGRSDKEIQLIAVSKKHSVESIQEIFEAGQFDFGENYVQELRQKQEALRNQKIRWHFIGGLQRKKIKSLVGQVETIQSVDRRELVEALQKACEELGVQQKILLQVNVGNEESKSGLTAENFQEVAEMSLQQKNLIVAGVMSLPPLTVNESEKRKYFEKTRSYLELLQKTRVGEALSVDVLSMGTTHDFELAIAEGATMVRVGTAIFGQR